MLSFDQRSSAVASKKFKPEFKLPPQPNNTGISSLILPFTSDDLIGYLELRSAGLAPKSITWLKKSARLFWNATNGFISVSTLQNLRNYVLEKYRDIDAKRKVLQFARAFLRYMSKISFDQRYAAFDLFLQLPRAVKEKKRVTERIVTKEDIQNVLTAIECSYSNGEISRYQYLNYRAITLFGATSGQRPNATIARLTVGQFKQALNRKKPVLDIPPECDKIRMQHYCPLHPQVVETVAPLLDGRSDNEHIFEQLLFERWLRLHKIPLLNGDARFRMGDLRKWCEQEGDILQWDQSNKNYILTHNVKGVDWRFYKSPRAEPVYDVYMQYWSNVCIAK